MEKIFITVNGSDRQEIEKGTTFYDVAKKYKSNFKYDIMLAQSGNTLYELSSPIKRSMDIKFLDMSNDEGIRSYTKCVT